MVNPAAPCPWHEGGSDGLCRKEQAGGHLQAGPLCCEKQLALHVCSAGVQAPLPFNPVYKGWDSHPILAVQPQAPVPCEKLDTLHAGFLVSPDEADELEHLVTSRTESVNIDHPNHIVTVTTISDLDLSGARQLGLTTPVVKPVAAILIVLAISIIGAG